MPGNRRHVPDAQKVLIVTMLENGMKPSQVRDATNLGLNTIYRVRKNWRFYGRVSRPALAPGCPRKLNSMQLDVSSESDAFFYPLISSKYLESLIELQPDIYLHEMKDKLRHVLGIFVSCETIMRALKQRGFTRKQVCFRYMWLCALTNYTHFGVAHKASSRTQ